MQFYQSNKFNRFYTDNLLKVSDHHGKGMGTNYGTDGVELVYGILEVALKGCIHCYLRVFHP